MQDFLINSVLTATVLAVAILASLLCGATLQGIAATVFLIAFGIGSSAVLYWTYERVDALRGWLGFLK